LTGFVSEALSGGNLKGKPQGQDQADDDGKYNKNGILDGIFLFGFNIVVQFRVLFVHDRKFLQDKFTPEMAESVEI